MIANFSLPLTAMHLKSAIPTVASTCVNSRAAIFRCGYAKMVDPDSRKFRGYLNFDRDSILVPSYWPQMTKLSDIEFFKDNHCPKDYVLCLRISAATYSSTCRTGS